MYYHDYFFILRKEKSEQQHHKGKQKDSKIQKCKRYVNRYVSCASSRLPQQKYCFIIESTTIQNNPKRPTEKVKYRIWISDTKKFLTQNNSKTITDQTLKQELRIQHERRKHKRKARERQKDLKFEKHNDVIMWKHDMYLSNNDIRMNISLLRNYQKKNKQENTSVRNEENFITRLKNSNTTTNNFKPK